MDARLRLGLQIPSFNFPGVGPDALFERLADIAATAESSGFDSLWVMDHLHQIANIGPRMNWMLEGNTVLAALAARTKRVDLGLMVGGVTYRNPALLAKITTTLDIVSAGRAVLGIGAAWFEDEHRAYGFDFPPLGERFERLEEALQISRAMFTRAESSFEGRHYRTENVLNVPLPIRGRIPIMVGGSGERKTLRLVAQYADASNVFGDPQHVRRLMGVLAGHCEAVGRDPAEIVKTRLGTIVIGRTQEDAKRRVATLREERIGAPEDRFRTMVTAGDPDSVAEQVSRFLEAGLDGMIVNLADVHDLETVALVGGTLAPLVA